jgi:hypothetical protein
VRSHDPLRISLFDPNPLFGDPSWDIAPMSNNVGYGEGRQRLDGESSEALTRDRDLLTGFWETYRGTVFDRLLLVAKLVQAVLQSEHRETTAHDGRFDDRDVEVTRRHLHDLIDRMST